MRDLLRASHLAPIVALVAVALVAALPPASAQASPGFAVTGTQLIEHRSLTVEGAIVIESGGSLTLDTVELTLAPGAGADPALVVKPGGTLVVRHSTVAAASSPLRVELGGSTRIVDSTFRGLAADASNAPGPALSTGFRIAPGGLLIASDDVVLDGVSVEGSEGCAVTVFQASPTLRGLDLSGVAYRTAGSDGFASGVCVSGGSPTIDGLKVSAIGSSPAGATGALYSAAVVADAPLRLVVRDLDAAGFTPALPGHPAARSAAVVVESPGSVVISGGRIEGTTDGIVIRGSSAAPDTSIRIERLSVVNTASGPISVVAAYTSDPNINWNHLDITGCGGNGLYFESQYSGVTTAVTATVDNVTAKSCGGVGIDLYDNGAQGAHTFNVWSSNASGNGQEGFFLHGVNMAAGLNINMADNGAWNNSYAGIRVSATYSSGGAAKIASGKFERNTADNNSYTGTFSDSGGIYAQFGAPATLSVRYLYNTARGNGAAGGFANYYGHYLEVHATNSINIGSGWITGTVARNNTDYGFGIVGGGGGIRMDGVRMNDSTITGQPTGIFGVNARIEVWNSTLSNAAEFEGQLTGFYVMGSVHTRLTGTTTGLFKIISYKQICLHGVWQNNAPLYLVPLTFTAGVNNSAASIYGDVSVDPPTAAPNRQTDMNGNWSGWVLDWTYDPQLPASQNQRADYAPLTIVVQVYQTSAKSPAFDLNTNICGTVLFTDPNPPDIIVSAPRENATYTRANLTVQGSVTDDLSGVAGLQVSLGGSVWVDLPVVASFSYTFTGLGDGVYNLFVRAWDRANVGIDPRGETLVVLYDIGIDTTKPILSLSQPPLFDGDNYWTSNSQIFFLGHVDENTSQLYVNGQPVIINGTAFLFIGDLPNEGPQSFLFLAVDFAGNTQNLTVTIFKDTVVPTLIVTAPVGRGEIFVSSRTLLVTGITDPNAVISVNGVPAAVVNGTFSATVLLAEGRNLINLSAVDAAGNPTTRTLVVTADTIAPDIFVNSPTDGEYLNSSRLELDGSISEVVEFLEINLRIFQVSGLTFQAVMGLAEGPNTLSINATDRAGNVGHREVRVTVDTHAPDITLFSLPDLLVRNVRQLAIHGAVSETASVEVNGVPADLTGLDFDAAVVLLEGANTITFTATDLAGNRATVLRHVTLDTAEPTIDVLEPKAGENVHLRVIRIVGTVEPNATVMVGSQLIQADAAGNFVAWITLESDGANLVNITVTDAAGNRASKVYTVNYAAEVHDASGDLYVGLGGMAALAAGLAVAGHFLMKRRVEGEVSRAREAQVAKRAQEAGTPDYTEPYGQAQPYDPQHGYALAEAPPPGAAEQPPPPPPRPPRPPRPPSN